MESKPASISQLGGLHDLVTKAFIRKVQGKVVTNVNAVGEAVDEFIEPSAAELAAAVTFLKNNNVTSAPSEDNAIGELQRLMDARRARSKPVLPDTLADMPGEMH
jgi:hypothetical protein